MARFGLAVGVGAVLAALAIPIDGHAQSVTTGYAYDVHGRLTKVTRPNGASDYTYDNADNRLRVQKASVANRPPVANPGTTDPVWQNTTVGLDVRANDSEPDGDALTIVSIDNFYFAYGRINGVDLTSAPADIGSVTNNGNSITYRAPFLTNSGATGSSYIVVVAWYTVSDGRGGTSQSYQIINVYGPS